MFTTLLYHIIDRTICDKIAISEEAFEAQLRYLHAEGYTVLSLAQACDILDGKREAIPRSVLLTFDDGYADNLHVALPLLHAYDMSATLFVISAFVGQTNRWNPKACYDVNHLRWDELQAWLEGGCDIGGHTHEHLCMTRLSGREIQDAVAVNKQVLEEQLHLKLRAFSYPYGAYNQAVQQVVRTHYEFAFAVEAGGWDAKANRYAINRLTVNPKWGIGEFAKRLESLTGRITL